MAGEEAMVTFMHTVFGFKQTRLLSAFACYCFGSKSYSEHGDQSWLCSWVIEMSAHKSVNCGPGQWGNRTWTDEHGSKTSVQGDKYGRTTHCRYSMWFEDPRWINPIEQLYCLEETAHLALGTSGYESKHLK